MCSFYSFFHLFPASFSLIRHRFSPAVSSDNSDCTSLNFSTHNQNLSFPCKKVHQVWERIMHPTIQSRQRPCLLKGCGWHGPTITTGSLIWQPDLAACSSAMSSTHCRSQPHPLHEVNIECTSGKAQSSCVEGAHSPHTKPGGSEKEDALLTSPAAPEPTALQLHSLQAST